MSDHRKVVRDFPTIDETADMRGPTPCSNWVIPRKLMAGAYPGDTLNEMKHRATIAAIVEAGVTTFVCLMTEAELERFRPYQEVTTCYVAEQNKKTLEFISFPIPDRYVTWDENVLDFIPKLVNILRRESECVYVHCWGGHGRTGTIIALLLAYMYNLDSDRALYLTGAFHGQRVASRSCSPQTSAQIRQVERLVPRLKEKETTSLEARNTCGKAISAVDLPL